jgi:hypothetical protein
VYTAINDKASICLPADQLIFKKTLTGSFVFFRFLLICCIVRKLQVAALPFAFAGKYGISPKAIALDADIGRTTQLKSTFHLQLQGIRWENMKFVCGQRIGAND